MPNKFENPTSPSPEGQETLTVSVRKEDLEALAFCAKQGEGDIINMNNATMALEQLRNIHRKIQELLKN